MLDRKELYESIKKSVEDYAKKLPQFKLLEDGDTVVRELEDTRLTMQAMRIHVTMMPIFKSAIEVTKPALIDDALHGYIFPAMTTIEKLFSIVYSDLLCVPLINAGGQGSPMLIAAINDAMVQADRNRAKEGLATYEDMVIGVFSQYMVDPSYQNMPLDDYLSLLNEAAAQRKREAEAASGTIFPKL